MKNIFQISYKEICIIILIFLSSFDLIAQNENKKTYQDNIIIFKVKEDYKSLFTKDKQYSSFLSDLNVVSVEKEFPGTESPKQKYNKYGQKLVDLSLIYRIELSGENDIENIINSFNELKFIEYAEPLYELEFFHIPNDPLASSRQYWIEKIKADEGWEIHKGDTNIVIGISDTGIDLSHPDLIYNIKYNYADIPDGVDNDQDGYKDNFRGWNFADNNNNPQEADDSTTWHGVYVCGIAGASTNNGQGVAGAGYECRIIPLKISNTSGTIINSYQSIVYAAEHGFDVLNCSWGGTKFQKMAQDVINYAVLNHDLLIIAACGNSNTEIDYYPASYENVISVAATTENDEKWTYLNTGTSLNSGSSYSYNVDISAPGTMFYTTTVRHYKMMYGGTSFAAPIVAGCAGILRSYYPDYSALQIGEVLKKSADYIYDIEANIPYAGKLGSGRLNLLNALTLEPTPSIVFRNYNFNYYNDRIVIEGDFCNFLDEASNLTIKAQIDSDLAYLQNETIFTGNLQTLEVYSTDQIIINLTNQVSYGNKLKLEFIYEADGYNDKQVLEFIINKEFKEINTDILSLSVTGHGRLGYGGLAESGGNGLSMDDYYKLISECGIIAGTDDKNIYSSVRQVSDFRTKIFPEKLEPGQYFDSHFRTEFDDSYDMNSKGLIYIQDIYASYGEQFKNFFIVDYTIKNDTEEDIRDFYFGLFTDWDLVGTSNSTGYINDEQFLYCKSDYNQTMYAGIKVLSRQNVNNYAVPLIVGGDGLVDVENGLLDIERFYLISNSNEGYDGGSVDIAIYTGAGPFDIAANDSVIVGFSIIVSKDYYNFTESLNNSKSNYENIHKKTYTEIIRNEKLNIYPNPSNDIINLNLKEGISDYSCQIINILGEIVFEIKNLKESHLGIGFLPIGIYNVRIFNNTKTYNGQFVKIN